MSPSSDATSFRSRLRRVIDRRGLATASSSNSASEVMATLGPREQVHRAEHPPGQAVMAPRSAGPPDQPPHPRRWVVFAIVGVALLMMSIDQTSVATALSALQADLGTSIA
jgi:hypothetical protein